MPFPNLGALQPAFDQYGNSYSVNPLVGKQTAGGLAPGQSLFSASGRQSTSTTAALTFPVVTVPANGVLFITDFAASAGGSSASGTPVEMDIQLQSGAITIGRSSISGTSPVSQAFETQPMVIPGQVLSVVLPITTATQPVDFYVAGYFQAFGF